MEKNPAVVNSAKDGMERGPAPTSPAGNPQAAPFEAAGPATEVYAVLGAEPEVNAYALARYSRSALSLRDSLSEIDGQKAEKFLNTFYFQYGHRSIADLAHISFAVERLSILAAIELADESRWDGQERSTRYQQFRRSGWIAPSTWDAAARRRLHDNSEFLFGEYEWLTARALDHLKRQVACPPDMKPDAYERTLRARAFDVARYLLPLATATSLGQIVSARTLEQQVVRLLSSPYPEVRDLGAALRRAATEPAYDVRRPRTERVVRALKQVVARTNAAGACADTAPGAEGVLADDAAGVSLQAALADAEALNRPIKAAPTLVKYADPSPYQIETRPLLRQAAAELMAGAPPATDRRVELVADVPLEIELSASLLYPHSRHSYRQLCHAVEALSAARREEIVKLALGRRGRHDELARSFQCGYRFSFDILMDIGGFRDMHRHRRCLQLRQDYSFDYGFETPALVAELGETARYDCAIERARANAAGAAASPYEAAYFMPLACRCRTLFKMDLAEVAYIAELRTAPAGHFSYREAAWELLEELRKLYPAIAAHIRATDPAQPVDLLQR